VLKPPIETGSQHHSAVNSIHNTIGLDFISFILVTKLRYSYQIYYPLLLSY